MKNSLPPVNGFTHGFGNKPHGYVPGQPSKPAKLPQRHVKAGIGAGGGTIPGMGTPTPSKYNGALKK